MTIKQILVGTTAIPFLKKSKDNMELCDFFVQNLHATQLLYIIDSDKGSASTGIRVAAAGGTYTGTDSDENLWLIASGASTDVRVRFNFKPNWDKINTLQRSRP